jgi:hypothetical protein
MKLMNPDLTSMQTNDLFQRIDQDGNHCISFIEFLAATLDPDDVDANELKQVRGNVWSNFGASVCLICTVPMPYL